MNKKVVIGGGIALLLYFLWSRKKDTDASSPVTTKQETVNTQTQEDLSDIPQECLDGFTLDGVKYEIKDGEFYKI